MSDEAFKTLEAFLERVPYARFLGLRVELAGDEMTAILPFSQHLVGNPILPALHGGVIGAFMEMTALAQLSLAHPAQRIPKTIDITIEYLRPVLARETFARATLRSATALHGAAFDARTGRVLTLPAVKSVRSYPVTVDGDDVSVDGEAGQLP